MVIYLILECATKMQQGCVADAKNSGIELKGVGLALPQFTCLPVADGKEIKLLAPSTPKSAFPF